MPLMSEKYRLMIYVAVATMHFYRAELVTFDPDNVKEYMERNKAVMSRIFDEVLNTFGYELSIEQMHRAIVAYRSFPCSMSEPAFDLAGL